MSNVQDNAAHTCSYSCDRPQCIKAQRDELAAAAAQEAVGAVVENVNGEVVSYRGVLFAKFILSDNFAPGMKLYAVPVTAAPTGFDRARETPRRQRAVELLLSMGYQWHGGEWIAASTPAAPEPSYLEYLDLQNHSLRRAIHAMMAKLVFLLDEDQFADIDAIALAAGVTPAAPGIDLEHFHRAVQRICIKFDGDLPYISGIAEVLDLIDASPKPAAAPGIDLSAAHQIAFEIGGDDEGGYQFTAEELEQFVTRLIDAGPKGGSEARPAPDAIDWRRDSAEVIRDKITERAAAYFDRDAASDEEVQP